MCIIRIVATFVLSVFTTSSSNSLSHFSHNAVHQWRFCMFLCPLRTRLVDCRLGYWSHIWTLDIWSHTHAHTCTKTDWRWQESSVITIDRSQQRSSFLLSVTHTHFNSGVLSSCKSLLFTVRLCAPLSCAIRSVWWPDRPPRRPAAHRPPVTQCLAESRQAWSEASCLSSTRSNRRDPSRSCRSNGGKTVPASCHSSQSPW